MTQISHPATRLGPAPLCREQILGLLLEGAGLSEIRIEVLIDRLVLGESSSAIAPRGRP